MEESRTPDSGISESTTTTHPEDGEVHGRNPKLAIRLSCAVLAGIGLVLAAYLVTVKTAWGRAQLALGVETALTALLPGSVSVGGIERASWSRVHVTQLKFAAPDGSSVLELDSAEVRVGRAALLQGNVEISEATVSGGTLHLEERPDGSVPLELAFSSPQGAPSSLDVSIRRVRVNDLQVIVDLDGAAPLRVAGVNALVRIERRPKQGVEVVFDQVDGTVVEGLPLGELELNAVSGRVRGKAEHVLTINGPAEFLGDSFSLHIDYYNRDNEPVVLRLADLDFSVAGLGGLGLAAIDGLLPGVQVHLGERDPEDGEH